MRFWKVYTEVWSGTLKFLPASTHGCCDTCADMKEQFRRARETWLIIDSLEKLVFKAWNAVLDSPDLACPVFCVETVSHRGFWGLAATIWLGQDLPRPHQPGGCRSCARGVFVSSLARNMCIIPSLLCNYSVWVMKSVATFASRFTFHCVSSHCLKPVSFRHNLHWCMREMLWPSTWLLDLQNGKLKLFQCSQFNFLSFDLYFLLLAILFQDGMDQAKWSVPRARHARVTKSEAPLLRPRFKIQGIWTLGWFFFSKCDVHWSIIIAIMAWPLHITPFVSSKNIQDRCWSFIAGACCKDTQRHPPHVGAQPAVAIWRLDCGWMHDAFNGDCHGGVQKAWHFTTFTGTLVGASSEICTCWFWFVSFILFHCATASFFLCWSSFLTTSGLVTWGCQGWQLR